MREVLDELLEWWSAGEAIGVGTVLNTARSALQSPGATMPIGPGGSVVGAVSGGCVERAVYDVAAKARETCESTLHWFGVSDEDAFAAGLTRGGDLATLVGAIDQDSFPGFDEFVTDVKAGRPTALATSLSTRTQLWSANGSSCVPVIRCKFLATSAIDGSTRRSLTTRWISCGQAVMAFSSSAPRGWARMPPVRVHVRTCASHDCFRRHDFAKPVTTAGRFLNYDVTLSDARPLVATHQRFPEPDRVVTDWPHHYLAAERDVGRLDARTALAALTHDPKSDVPLLEVALRLPDIAYVGATGSRRAHRIGCRVSVPSGCRRVTHTPSFSDRTGSARLFNSRDCGEHRGRDGGAPVSGTGRHLSFVDGRIHQHAATGRWVDFGA